MAIRRANILGILNEMYEAEHKEHQQERDFAIKGVGLAIDAKNKKELRRLEEKRLAITEADANVRAKRTEQIIKLEDAKAKNEENKEIFNKLSTLATNNRKELAIMTQEMATRLYDRVIVPSFTMSNGEVGFTNTTMIKKFTELIGNEPLAKDLIQFGMTRNPESGLFPEIETEAILYELFGNEDTANLLQQGFGFYGDNQFAIDRMTKIQDDFFLFKAQNDEIAQELREYQGLGDTSIGEPLKNLLLYGSTEAPLRTDEDTIVDLGNDMIGTIPEGALDTSEYEVVSEEEIVKSLALNKDIPSEILKIQDSLGPLPTSEFDKIAYFDKVEDVLNQNSTAWTAYKDEYGDVDTSLPPRKNYKQAKNFRLDIVQEINKSENALRQHERKIYEKETLHGKSTDKQFYYSDEDRANDAKIAYLFKLQLGLLNYHKGVANKRTDDLTEVMSPAGRFFSGAGLDQAFDELEKESGVNTLSLYGLPFQRRNR